MVELSSSEVPVHVALLPLFISEVVEEVQHQVSLIGDLDGYKNKVL